MLTLDQCRQILGSGAEDLSDSELADIRAALHGLAEVALDVAEGDLTVCATEGSMRPSGGRVGQRRGSEAE